ncbi:MAG: MBL fold metallo-hydrolase [Firmicutes bacterium]|nr:MBL fold metallo-hydrolase [Bacillota bacterium]
MDIKVIKVGPLETNCYILTIENESIIIDPGDDFNKIKEAIGTNKVIGCLVTHFHQDHIEALEEVVSHYDVEINKPKYGKFNYEIIETPGHTFDSKTFYFKDINTMFTGDFIFKSSIGRTDLGGNDKDMIDSLEKFKQYDDDITIYPGHGPKTTLGQEKINFIFYY